MLSFNANVKQMTEMSHWKKNMAEVQNMQQVLASVHYIANDLWTVICIA